MKELNPPTIVNVLVALYRKRSPSKNVHSQNEVAVKNEKDSKNIQ